jgi:hypothetical protein
MLDGRTADAPQMLPGLMSPIFVVGGVGLFVETRVFHHEKFTGPGPSLGESIPPFDHPRHFVIPANFAKVSHPM